MSSFSRNTNSTPSNKSPSSSSSLSSNKKPRTETYRRRDKSFFNPDKTTISPSSAPPLRSQRSNSNSTSTPSLTYKDRKLAALQLNTTLQTLARSKRTAEALQVYNDPVNAQIIDGHHASIVVNACVRGGEVGLAEVIVSNLEKLYNAQCLTDESERKNHKFKNHSNTNRGKHHPVSIQAYTALLKGYAHAGDLSAAFKLFKTMCAKNRLENKYLRPNVRSMNTFLRAVVWGGNDCGGEVNYLDEAWDLYGSAVRSIRFFEYEASSSSSSANASSGNSNSSNSNEDEVQTDFDCSSYEYYITSACCALRVNAASSRLSELEKTANLESETQTQSENDNRFFVYGEAIIASIAAIVRARVLLGDNSHDVKVECDRNLSLIKRMEGVYANHDFNFNDYYVDGGSGSGSGSAVGGKRSYISVSASASASASNDDVIAGNNSNVRIRNESNKLFRTHKLNEMKLLTLSLKSRVEKKTWRKELLVEYLREKVFFFGGGGSTDKRVESETVGDSNAYADADADEVDEEKKRLLSGLDCFGFSICNNGEIEVDKDNDNNKSKHNKNKDKAIPTDPSPSPSPAISSNTSNTSNNSNPYDQTLTKSGRLHMPSIFSSNPTSPIAIELGSGTGTWLTHQANANPSCNYIAVEMRADRVAQTISNFCLNLNLDKSFNGTNGTNGATGNGDSGKWLSNTAVVGSECSYFLSSKIKPNTVTTIYCNHPEPPTQNSTDLDFGGHMLNEKTLINVGKCLVGGGVGRFVIVSDNYGYTKSLAKSMADVMGKEGNEGLFVNDDKDVGKGKSETYYHDTKRGVYVTVSVIGGSGGSGSGTSYFDRLWSTGAGSHASKGERYVITLRSGKGKGKGSNWMVAMSETNANSASAASVAVGGRQMFAKGSGEEGGRGNGGGVKKGKGKNNKKSSEKQKKRNERRAAAKEGASS